MAKTNQSRRKRKKAAPHPMSAGHREQSGRRSRADKPRNCGPTRELIQRLAEHGPTDMIQRAAKTVIGHKLEGGYRQPIYFISEDEQKALEMFGMIRRVIGVAEVRYKNPMDVMMPGAGSHANPEVMDWAMQEYRNAIGVLAGDADACQDITDNRAPTNIKAVKSGAIKLATLWIRGEAKRAAA